MAPPTTTVFPVRVGHAILTLHQRVLARRWRRRLVAILLAIAAVVGLALSLAALLASSRPAWWHEENPTDPATRALATAFENGLVTVLTESRVGTTWSARIKAKDASAWLAARFPAWLMRNSSLDRWPARLGMAQVHFDSGQIIVAISLRPLRAPASAAPHHLSLRITPRIESDGSLWARAKTIAVGRLPIPASLVLTRAGIDAPPAWLLPADDLPAQFRDLPQTHRFSRVLLGNSAALAQPVLTLSDGRCVRLLALRCANETLEVTCRTEPPTPRTSH